MPKHYEVLEQSFINGRLYNKGERLELEIDSPGSNLKLVPAPADDDDSEKEGILAELAGFGVKMHPNTGIEKLRAALAEKKGA